MNEWIGKYWLGWLFGLLGTGLLAGFGVSWKWFKKRLRSQKVTDAAIADLDKKVAAQQAICEDQQAIKNAMMALLWDRLFKIYDEAEREERISVDALKNAETIYDCYHKLGGNGTGTELYQRLCDLPTRKTKIASLEK